jgi:hypothetical protein
VSRQLKEFEIRGLVELGRGASPCAIPKGCDRLPTLPCVTKSQTPLRRPDVMRSSR